MTKDQLKQWNERACVFRCLIKLAEMKNRQAINIDEFAERLKRLFPDREISDGSFDPQSLSKVCKLLGLPERSQQSHNYSDIEREFNTSNRPVLIMSEVDLNPGNIRPWKHCSVLTKIDSKAFSVWTPRQDGNEEILPLDRSDWTTKKCFGIAFY
jgi:hypothetical protein